jgi:hypothetical protein
VFHLDVFRNSASILRLFLYKNKVSNSSMNRLIPYTLSSLMWLFSAEPALAGEPTPYMTIHGSHVQIGKDFYPTSRYPGTANTYVALDKENTDADASLVLRDHGNARVEIGIIGDNDLHIKTVNGAYGSEIFTDRMIIHAENGTVDSFGTIFRQYGIHGAPTIVIGNSDLSNGAGLELTYDQDKKTGHISSVEHGNGYSPLLINSSGVRFFGGEDSSTEVANLSDKGGLTAAAVISGGSLFTVSGCSAGEAVGGSAAGRFRIGMTGACTVTVTINGDDSIAAPNGWACSASNLTRGVNLTQTASTRRTATLAGKTMADDIISFYCMGY